MKRIAFYLPQFHSIPENDEWWGEGFTEWTNVKKSRPYFKGHIQPEIPLDENYYCLDDVSVLEEQSELALSYGIDGFCYYHYWFEGKKLLEKPIEQMLNNKNIKIPFCLCWANESWSRTWDGAENQILIKQNYDESIEAWKTHFEYLLHFFKDDRYIKFNNKPVLILYKPQLINHCKNMIDYWDKLAKNAGFNGLYVGCQHPSALDKSLESTGMDFGIEFEPLFSMKCEKDELDSILKKCLYSLKHPVWLLWKIRRLLFNYPNVHDYDIVWQRIINRSPDEKMAPGAFPAWDNTPRRGKDADVYYKSTPEKFKKYFREREKNAEQRYEIPFLFINAWNEWAEGAHLEGDSINGMAYLEAIKRKNNSIKNKM